MAVYLVTGNLGSGKSVITMGKMRDYLWRNRRVATNVNVRVENLVSGKHYRDIVRTPDWPSAEYLWDGLGYGSDTKDESKFGMFLVDEVGTWLNARTWGDKDRPRVIEWFVHSRKRRWDCYLVAQSVNMIDKQVREAIGEHVVICRRYDRMGIPMIGPLISMLGAKLRLPQVHVAAVRYCAGMAIDHAPTVDRWFYSGRDLWGTYDTGQRFGPPPPGKEVHYKDAAEKQRDARIPNGLATMLSPDKYTWLQKPHNLWMSAAAIARQRGWHRVEAILEAMHEETTAERNYRLLALWEEHGNILAKQPSRSFDQWQCDLARISAAGEQTSGVCLDLNGDTSARLLASAD